MLLPNHNSSFVVRLENSFTSPVNYGIPLWCTLSQEKSRIVPVFNNCQVLLFLKRVLIETIHVIIINRSTYSVSETIFIELILPRFTATDPKYALPVCNTGETIHYY